MTINELIEKLSYYDKTDEVIVYDINNSFGSQIEDVFKDEQVCIEIGQLI